jgi:S1-C subfamily serine protease
MGDLVRALASTFEFGGVVSSVVRPLTMHPVDDVTTEYLQSDAAIQSNNRRFEPKALRLSALSRS